MTTIVILNRDGKIVKTEKDISLSFEEIFKVTIQLVFILIICIGLYFIINNFTIQSSIIVLNFIIKSIEILIPKICIYTYNVIVISLTLYIIIIWIYCYYEEKENNNSNNNNNTKMNKFNNISSTILSKNLNLSNLIKNIFIKNNESFIRISNNNNNNNNISYIKSNTSLISVTNIQLYINEVRIIDENDTTVLEKDLKFRIRITYGNNRWYSWKNFQDLKILHQKLCRKYSYFKVPDPMVLQGTKSLTEKNLFNDSIKYFRDDVTNYCLKYLKSEQVLILSWLRNIQQNFIHVNDDVVREFLCMEPFIDDYNNKYNEE